MLNWILWEGSITLHKKVLSAPLKENAIGTQWGSMKFLEVHSPSYIDTMFSHIGFIWGRYLLSCLRFIYLLRDDWFILRPRDRKCVIFHSVCTVSPSQLQSAALLWESLISQKINSGNVKKRKQSYDLVCWCPTYPVPSSSLFHIVLQLKHIFHSFFYFLAHIRTLFYVTHKFPSSDNPLAFTLITRYRCVATTPHWGLA